MQSTRNTVPVPRHWCFKRKYLQGKRGIEKPPFRLPDFIKATGVMEMRQALDEKEDHKSLKAKTRERVCLVVCVCLCTRVYVQSVERGLIAFSISCTWQSVTCDCNVTLTFVPLTYTTMLWCNTKAIG